MNFNNVNRSTLLNAYYTDRPSYNSVQPNELNRYGAAESNHLNPSKSKVNVRQSLNKTT